MTGPSTSLDNDSVLGNLLSGVLAHRSALRSKAMDLDHAERQRREERSAEERRETVNERKPSLRDVYAEAQMVAPDDVLAATGNLVHRLHRIHALLAQHEQQTPVDVEESLGDISERLERASQCSYEVRQTMRKDLGITEMPVRRSEGYGAT